MVKNPPFVVIVPPSTAAGWDNAPTAPGVSLVNKPAVLIVTPFATVVLPAKITLELGAKILALILVWLDAKFWLSLSSPLGLSAIV